MHATQEGKDCVRCSHVPKCIFQTHGFKRKGEREVGAVGFKVLLTDGAIVYILPTFRGNVLRAAFRESGRGEVDLAAPFSRH